VAEHEWMKPKCVPWWARNTGVSTPGTAVNAPMIRHWCEVMGIENPAYTDAGSAAAAARGGLVAPATMLQVWCLEGPEAEQLPAGSTTENPYEASS
jgi:hypothetical protein